MRNAYDAAHQLRIIDFIGERHLCLGDVADGLRGDSPDATRGQMSLMIGDGLLVMDDDMRVSMNWHYAPLRSVREKNADRWRAELQRVAIECGQPELWESAAQLVREQLITLDALLLANARRENAKLVRAKVRDLNGINSDHR